MGHGKIGHFRWLRGIFGRTSPAVCQVNRTIQFRGQDGRPDLRRIGSPATRPVDWTDCRLRSRYQARKIDVGGGPINNRLQTGCDWINAIASAQPF
jgi:hypothetical protein